MNGQTELEESANAELQRLQRQVGFMHNLCFKVIFNFISNIYSTLAPSAFSKPYA